MQSANVIVPDSHRANLVMGLKVYGVICRRSRMSEKLGVRNRISLPDN